MFVPTGAAQEMFKVVELCVIILMLRGAATGKIQCISSMNPLEYTWYMETVLLTLQAVDTGIFTVRTTSEIRGILISTTS